MNIKFIILLVVTVALVAEVSSHCLCGAKGTDRCSCSGHIVRPFPLIRFDSKPRQVCSMIGGAQTYQPIGDVCSCGSSIVKPAVNPRTCSTCNKIKSIDLSPRPSCHDTVRAPEEFQGVSVDGANIYASAYKQYRPSIPVDAVSMSLAYNMAKRASISVPEEKLQYGFRSMPKNQPFIKQTRDIPEERLWGSDRAVIELKPVKRQEEEEEFEDIIEEEEEVDRQPSHLSYHQLCYDAAKPKNCDFIVQREDYQPEPCQDQVPEDVGDCGFKPGNLIEQEDNYDYSEEKEDNYRDEYHDDFYENSDIKSNAGCGCGGGSPILSKLFNKNFN